MLTRADIVRYSLSGIIDGQSDGAEDPRTKKDALRQILDEAGRIPGFDGRGRMFIQLYPSRDGGAEIYITRLTSRGAEAFRRGEDDFDEEIYKERGGLSGGFAEDTGISGDNLAEDTGVSGGGFAGESMDISDSIASAHGISGDSFAEDTGVSGGGFAEDDAGLAVDSGGASVGGFAEREVCANENADASGASGQNDAGTPARGSSSPENPAAPDHPNGESASANETTGKSRGDSVIENGEKSCGASVNDSGEKTHGGSMNVNCESASASGNTEPPCADRDASDRHTREVAPGQCAYGKACRGVDGDMIRAYGFGRSEARERRVKVSRTGVFPDMTSLLLCCRALRGLRGRAGGVFAESGAAYTDGKRYFLMLRCLLGYREYLERSDARAVEATIREYGALTDSRNAEAYIEEHCTSFCESGAVSILAEMA